MKVLVTGATGNLGTALLETLAADPDVGEVVGVSRRRPAGDAAPYSTATWVGCDLTGPNALTVLTEAMRGCDAVVHLAWRFQPSHDEAEMRRTNVAGLRTVVNATVAAGVPHLVDVSSLGAYSAGPKDRKVDESWPTGGVHTSPYSRQKAATERLLDDVEASGVDLTISRARPTLAVQSRAASAITRYFAPSWLPASLAARVPAPLLPLPVGLLAQVVHSADVADALRLMVTSGVGGAFNLADDDVLGPQELARAVGAMGAVEVPARLVRAPLDLSWRLRVQPTDAGWLDLALLSPLVDTGRARRELGWVPSVPSAEALESLVRGVADRDGVEGSPTLGR